MGLPARASAAPLPILQLPTDHPRPPLQSFRGARHSLALSPELTVALKALCRAANVEKVEAGPRGAVVTLRNNEFPNPPALVRMISVVPSSATADVGMPAACPRERSMLAAARACGRVGSR